LKSDIYIYIWFFAIFPKFRFWNEVTNFSWIVSVFGAYVARAFVFIYLNILAVYNTHIMALSMMHDESDREDRATNHETGGRSSS
jgi:hypothetical protein